MLLRNSISSTKKFFQRTLNNFKSLFVGDSNYEKIPKSPFNNNQYSYTSTPLATDMNAAVHTNFNNNKDLEYRFYSDRWDTDNIQGKTIRRRNNHKKTLTPTLPAEARHERDSINGSFMKFSRVKLKTDHPVRDYQIQRREEDYSYINHHKNKVKGYKRSHETSTRYEERSFFVAQKLKELEMMDVSNVDHVLDVEEVLHYYSRLTCPAYLDIVDKFFMDMYAEFFAPPSTPRSVNSRPSLRS